CPVPSGWRQAAPSRVSARARPSVKPLPLNFQFPVTKNESPSVFMKTLTQRFGQKLTRTLCALSFGGILLAAIPEAFPADAWQALSNSGAPSPRSYVNNDVVWTGSEMIVWGGFDGGTLNDGGRYNPASNTWTATTTAGAPSVRTWHTTVWTGS